jgi:transcriptional antiterminator RfaH
MYNRVDKNNQNNTNLNNKHIGIYKYFVHKRTLIHRYLYMSKEWFILQFKANSHHQATKNLNQQGFETFLPLYDSTSRKMSRFISTSKPLFPGYMFIFFDRTETNWHKINNTYGVSRLITFNSILKSIPSSFIDNLKMRYDLSGKLVPIQKLHRGDQVKILKGPFANFIATVEACETDQRIWVLMDLMGRKTKIQATPDTLQSSD